jgi:hypothetical protein
MEIGKIETVKNSYQTNPFQQLGGQLGGQIQLEQRVYIPLNMSDWKKLSRETQIRVLEELGILSALTAAK